MPASMNLRSLHWWYKYILCALVLCGIFSCDSNSNPVDPNSKPPPKIGSRVNLTLVAFNYTDKYIDSYEVEEAGGGNVFVSDEFNGGSKATCCATYIAGLKKMTVKIRWQSAACTYNEYVDSAGVRHHDIYSFFKQAQVTVDPNIPQRPRYFETHFYPDGHVEAAITEEISDSRIKLSTSREDKSDYPRCPNDQKPSE